MKQIDFETSNYKHKEDIKTFVGSFNEMVDKYVKSFDNADADLKKVNSSIDKKNSAISKLETNLADMNKKTDELRALKELSNEEIKVLDAKKGEITFTDSEVQKMELEDINSQISSKKSKISKIDAKLDATKTKIKTSTDEKKTCEKELKELDKQRIAEEEALFKTQSIITLISETKDKVNSQVLEIINAPYRPLVNESVETTEESVSSMESRTTLDDILGSSEEIKISDSGETSFPDLGISEEELSVLDYADVNLDDIKSEPIVEASNSMPNIDFDINAEIPGVEVESDNSEISDSPSNSSHSELVELFNKEGISFDQFGVSVKEKMTSNQDIVMKNLEILKKHNVPIEYTQDQPEIYYDISSQDLDDLLSIITTDDEGNGMGFSIDFTYNILSELSKINVDKLIDVYNSEFMNVNSKSGIIHLLKLTNPSLKEFTKNRNTNIEILKSLGASTADAIADKYPDFINMDNPLFVSVLNVFDKNDLVEKLNSDVDVVPKIIEYWKNN